jgi:hypothetical protein
MASQKQTEANRRNARRSTGPKTPEGKAVVSQNTVRHGLLSTTVYVDEGEEPDLERLRADFLAHFQPAGPLEALLVDRIISNAWRLRRVLEVEALYQSHKVEKYMDGPTEYLGTMFSNIECLENVLEQGAKLTRYESFLERSLHKSLHELQRLQAARAGVPVPLPVAVDVEVSGVEPEAVDCAAGDNGFVS